MHKPKMKGPPVIVEMRTYTTRPGERQRFLDLFRAKSMPEHARLGMTIIGPFLDIEHDDRLFFMRGFPTIESREALKDSFYKGRLWIDELEAVLMPMLDRTDTVVVDDPDGLIG